jgi:hypothetical protein
VICFQNCIVAYWNTAFILWASKRGLFKKFSAKQIEPEKAISQILFAKNLNGF